MREVADSRRREHEYYSDVKQALENQFRIFSYSFDFEITGVPGKKAVPKRFLYKDEELLTKHLKELPTPDLMGLVWRQGSQNKKLVVAEFKASPEFRDVFQAKGYDELFNSDYTFLVGEESISESSQSTMDFIKNKPELLKTKKGKAQIYIMFLQRTPEGITLARLASETKTLPDIGAKLSL